MVNESFCYVFPVKFPRPQKSQGSDAFNQTKKEGKHTRPKRIYIVIVYVE